MSGVCHRTQLSSLIFNNQYFCFCYYHAFVFFWWGQMYPSTNISGNSVDLENTLHGQVQRVALPYTIRRLSNSWINNTGVLRFLVSN
jgi:hypothetical protein